MAIPDSMRAVQLRAYDGKPENIAVVEMPVPRPGSGEVLVRIFASPINPSDLMFTRGLYGFKKPLPGVPGFEGRGLLPRFLKGRRVAADALSCGATCPLMTKQTFAEAIGRAGSAPSTSVRVM